MSDRYKVDHMSNHPSKIAHSNRRYFYGVWDCKMAQWVLRSEFVSFSRAMKIKKALDGQN